MSTVVPFDINENDGDLKDLKNKLNLMCTCGHKLSHHGFTNWVDEYTKQNYLRVSQCVFCGCQQFKRSE